MTTAIEPTHATLTINGLKAHYVDYGSPFSGAADLVLLHGFTSAWGSWRRVAEHWSSMYRVVALDTRGHGDSGWGPADGYTTKNQLSDIEQFVDAIGLGRFILVGQSMGGHLAIGYTSLHPDRVIATIANDIWPSLPPRLTNGDRPKRDPNFKRQPIADLDAWIEKRVKDEPLTPRWAHELASRELLRKVEGGWEAKHDPATAPWNPDDHWDYLRAITRPILFIRGGRGVMTPEVLQEMVLAASTARSITLEKAGHLTFWDMEPEWIEIASAFLEQHARD